MNFFFIFLLVFLGIASTVAYFILFKEEKPEKYIWVGKGENPIKHRK